MTERKAALYRLLERPSVYALMQTLLAPGAERSITRRIIRLTKQMPPGDFILDVGCGPASWLWRAQLHPVGLDLSLKYTIAFRRLGHPAVTGSAAELPFPNQCFDSVWCIGLLHHLPDDMARQAVAEMLRVCRRGGYIAILDAVLPEHKLRRPVAYMLRRMDRGRFVRHQDNLISLLPVSESWNFERFTYALTGLELLGCYLTH